MSQSIDIAIGSTCTTAMLSPWMGYQTISTTQQNCTTNGSAMPPPPTWSTSTLFCQANPTSAGGCSAGSTCVAKPAGQACLVADGAAPTCPAGFTKQTLYTGVTDNRTCTACSCTASGGTCDSISIDVTPTCDGSQATNLNSGVHCTGSGSSNFIFQFFGAATAPSSCSTSSVVQGTATPSGAKTLCCR